jgi:hypothetical protein
VALALKTRRPVILLDFEMGGLFADAEKKGRLFREKTPEAVVARIKTILAG